MHLTINILTIILKRTIYKPSSGNNIVPNKAPIKLILVRFIST